MKVWWIVTATLALGACDTFRSLDSVPIPGDGISDGGVDAGTDGSTDAGVHDVDVRLAGDSGRDAERLDDGGEARDVSPDAAPDAGVSGCPAGASSPPPWTGFVDRAPTTIPLTMDGTAFEDISIAASPLDASFQRFAVGYRIDQGASGSQTRYGEVSATGEYVSFAIGHAVVDSFPDFAVQRAPDPDKFAYLAVAESTSCSGTGILAISGLLGGTGFQFSVENIEQIMGRCGELQPPAALTGPGGESPNFRLAKSDAITGAVHAYPWDDDTTVIVQDGMQFVSHISASTHELVATPAGFDEWWLWRPAVADEPVFADLGGTGPLEVEHLRESCYVGAVPSGPRLTYSPIDCTEVCQVGVLFDVDLGEAARRVAIAAIPGGGFVIASATGDAGQRVRLHFFGDDFSPVEVGGQSAIEVVAPRGRIGDLEVAATRDGLDVVIATAYAVGDAMGADAEVSLLRLAAP